VAVALRGGSGQEAGPTLAWIVNPAELTHAELPDHAARDAAGMLQVAGRAIGDFAVDQLLGPRAAQGYLDLAFQFPARHEVAIFLRPAQHVSERTNAPGNDRHLVNGVRVGQGTGNERMAGFVIGNALLLVDVHDAALALQADGAALDCLIEFGHRDDFLAAAG